MSIIEKANEVLAQISAFAAVSLPDVIATWFMKLVSLFLNLLLGG